MWVVEDQILLSAKDQTQERLETTNRLRNLVQGRRANKKLARGEVPPLLLKIDAVVGLETAFAFLKMAPDS